MKPTPPCEVCGTPIEMEIEMRLSAGYASTVAVFEHAEQVTCPTCGTALHLTIIGLPQVQMKTARVPLERRKQVVIPAKRIMLG